MLCRAILRCPERSGCIIARQRPGTAKGFIFLSMEDETGIANVIVTPDLYERNRLVVTRSDGGNRYRKLNRVRPIA
jgi:DNA polymerase III alpha subunit